MLICNADRLAHTNELFKKLYILKFPEFVQYKTAILIFNLFQGTLPIHLQNRFNVHSTTRSIVLIVLIALSRCNRVFTRRLRLCHSHTVRRHEVRKGEREGLNRVVSGL